MRTSEHRVLPLCEWTGGLVEYRIQPAGFGVLLLVARGPGDHMRVAALDTADGTAAAWNAMDDVERTDLAEQVLRRERDVLRR